MVTPRFQLLGALGLSLLVLGCLTHQSAIREVSVAEVAEYLKADSATVFDANDEDFRAASGTLPGAQLLSSFDTYDIASTLPKDKSRHLVFYCSNRL